MGDTWAGLAQAGILVVALAVVYRPLGGFMARVFTTDRHWRIERVIYRLVRVNPSSEQRWTTYALGVLAFGLVSALLLYALQRLQPLLPLSFGRSIPAEMAFNTAVSFATNTNWQSYVPESVMGHLVQMLGLTVHNFVSAGMGLAVAVALIRGFVRHAGDRLGNFWVDLTRAVVRILLPISFVFAIVLVGLGVTMSLQENIPVTGLDGAQHSIAIAPAAGQEVIKELGTNGGGIFNANAAHPFENPNSWSNLVEIFLILCIPVALTRTFGIMVGNKRQGYVLLSVMGVLWAGVLAVTWWAEAHPNGPAALLAGAAMEGKETRFGIPASTLFATSTTGTSTGAVNSMHDSFSGLGGAGPMFQMMLGEVSPGGVGTGIYGILVMAIIAVFLAGLMVGRTPEYLGKKLGRREVTFAAISMLTMPVVVLIGTGLALALPSVTGSSLSNPGAHGLSEVLYAYTSTANNNGSAFAGLTVTNNFYESTLGIAMLLGRFIPILATLALAGALVRQKKVPVSAGTLPTTGPLFSTMLGGTVLLVAALTFVPALALGPIAEALS
ncbi:potassium-transporting ATPase subunit KdpA [Amycolatopsis taiwanensis]|uniref:potassium-transporting ATPase subunit KdpA n=1 Tax=Amycolatopsis taiwanensis TaxID=342230 RepID=UPI00048199D1|nr:potassium-transporting ATPase subunit KdpA [Amycolatopsis taiwanensis]